ncbi:lipopolysaccharide biosynthesis protein [Endozoicomonas acroporae]|uniref:lipopolysaccharide biosynthesis protein n=1 Tax=Endozoicomonas acroporae TaxID=1701104 RepID=UPI003D7AC0A7
MMFNKIKSQRDKGIFKGIVTGILAKSITIVSGLVTIPFTLEYLGVERFGVWMTITGFVSFLTLSDFGLGIGLQNALTRCYGNDDKVNPKIYISTSYFLVSVLTVFILFCFLVSHSYVPFDRLFKFNVNSQDLYSESIMAVKLSCTAFIACIPINLIERVLVGYQKNYLANLLLCLGRVLGLFFIFISIYFDLGLYLLSFLFIVSPSIVYFVYTIFYFSKVENREMCPSIYFIRTQHFKDVVSTGGWNFLAQFSFALKENMPILIISSLVGVAQVSTFAVTQRIIGAILMFINVSLQSLWPAYGEAFYKRDKAWITKTLKRSIVSVLIISLSSSIIFVLFGKLIIDIWAGSEVVPSFTLLMLCAFWMVLSSINIALTMLLNGTNNFKSQATYGVALVILGSFFSYRFGIEVGMIGVVLSFILISELSRTIVFSIDIRRLLRNI